MTRGPLVIADSVLSHAWAHALLALCQRGTSGISPLIVTLTNLENGVRENPEIRNVVDGALRTAKMNSVQTTASTIFPSSMWNRGGELEAIYERYKAVYPRVHRSCRANQYGTYFHRMIAYQPEGAPEPVNQLDHIIKTYAAANHRRSALQAVIFDPTRDHTNQRRRGFPCLHQVAFSPLGDGTLAVTGFYGTQHIFQRGYGNYIGLCQLGEFMAQGFGMRLSRVTCIAAVAELGIKKEAVLSLAELLGAILGVAGEEERLLAVAGDEK